MTRTIVGLFEKFEDAQAAVKDLANNGFTRDEISLIANDKDGQFGQHFASRLGEKHDDDIKKDLREEHKESEHSSTARGAEIGAGLGGIAGLLVGIGTLLIPGIGPVLAAGPLLTVLGGTGAGAVTGGIIGSLAGVGVKEEDANLFAEGLRRGGTLVVVSSQDRRAEEASDILNRYHPLDLEKRAAEWGKQSWKGFNESAEHFAFTPPEGSFKGRESASEVDFGPGARNYLQGKPIREMDQSEADMSNYVNREPTDWLMYESRFQSHFKQNYGKEGKQWENYRRAYRFGYEIGHDPAYSNQVWDRIADKVQRTWELDYPQFGWDDYRSAVREGWEVGHVPH